MTPKTFDYKTRNKINYNFEFNFWNYGIKFDNKYSNILVFKKLCDFDLFFVKILSRFRRNFYLEYSRQLHSWVLISISNLRTNIKKK